MLQTNQCLSSCGAYICSSQVARFCIDVADELSARFSDITIEERLGFSSLLSHLVYFAKTLFSKVIDLVLFSLGRPCASSIRFVCRRLSAQVCLFWL